MFKRSILVFSRVKMFIVLILFLVLRVLALKMLKDSVEFSISS